MIAQRYNRGTLKLIGCCLAALWPALTPAASTTSAVDERALRESCSAASQAEMRDCLARKAESSQRALRQAEEYVAAALSKWDEDNRFISEARSTLSASQKQFSRYRDAQCQFLASLSGGGAGNSREIRRLACVSELNGRRAEQLRDAVSDLPLK